MAITATPTEWTACTCGYCSVATIMSADGNYKRRFWRHWEASTCMPVTVAILVTFCLTSYWIVVFPVLPKIEQIVSAVLVHFFTIMFLINYYMTVFMDPGFLPYNWHETKKTRYSWEEQPTHLAVSKEQLDYVLLHERPKCSFSKKSGRFVVRADHICGWVCNWVGKRNHKQFLLMTSYGALMSISLFVWSFMQEVSSKSRSSALYGIDITARVIEGFFLFILSMFSITTCSNLYAGTTTIEQWKEKKTKKESGCVNCKEVCGDGPVCCWICPCPAFGEELEINGEFTMQDVRPEGMRGKRRRGSNNHEVGAHAPDILATDDAERAGDRERPSMAGAEDE